MSPNLDYEFSYEDFPQLSMRVISAETASEASIEALIDTGSDITIFDQDVARLLRLDLTGRAIMQFRGIGGELQHAPTVEIQLMPLFQPDLAVNVRVAFVPRMLPGVGNLIGRDVLEFLDFGLTHSARLGYLGRTEALA